MSEDEKYMRRCLQLAANGIQGADLVSIFYLILDSLFRFLLNFKVHEEEEFVLDDGAADGDTGGVVKELAGGVLMTPPCADLIIKKGVRRVVVGCIDPFAEVQGRGIKKLQDADIEVTVGVLEKECQWLNRRFFTYHSKHRPYIILKWAQTANGFIDDHGQALQISNEQTQMLSHQLRAEEDAILVGHTTDIREHPQLTVRHWHGPNPKRIVLTHDRPLPQLMDDLYQHGIQSLIVEGGRQTHEAEKLPASRLFRRSRIILQLK